MTEILDFVYDNTLWFFISAVASLVSIVFCQVMTIANIKNNNIGFIFFMGMAFSAASMWVSWVGFLVGIVLHLIAFAADKVK